MTEYNDKDKKIMKNIENMSEALEQILLANNETIVEIKARLLYMQHVIHEKYKGEKEN